MRALLIGRNRALVRTVQSLNDLIKSASAPAELDPYRAYVLEICAHLTGVLSRNLDDLDRGPDQFSKTY